MTVQPALIARYYMPRVPAGYLGRVHVVLPEPANPQLVDWCKAQDAVTGVVVGSIEPTSLALMLDSSETPEAGQKLIRGLIALLAEQIGQEVRAEAVTTFHSHLQRLRQQGPPAYTPEMQFLTEPYWVPGSVAPRVLPIDDRGQTTPHVSPSGWWINAVLPMPNYHYAPGQQQHPFTLYPTSYWTAPFPSSRRWSYQAGEPVPAKPYPLRRWRETPTTAAFRRSRTFHGTLNAWLKLTLNDDPPAGFSEWCASQPRVSSVEKSDEHQYTLWFYEFTDAEELLGVVLKTIEAASVHLDYGFVIDNQGIHVPPLVPGDGRHLPVSPVNLGVDDVPPSEQFKGRKPRQRRWWLPL